MPGNLAYTGKPSRCGSSYDAAHQSDFQRAHGSAYVRALGEAVIRVWSNLPQEVQYHLFKEAVALKASP
jgi:hypothetical protein